MRIGEVHHWFFSSRRPRYRRQYRRRCVPYRPWSCPLPPSDVCLPHPSAPSPHCQPISNITGYIEKIESIPLEYLSPSSVATSSRGGSTFQGGCTLQEVYFTGVCSFYWNCPERQILWSLCSHVYNCLFELYFMWHLNFVRSLEYCQSFSKMSTPVISTCLKGLRTRRTDPPRRAQWPGIPTPSTNQTGM